MPHLLTLALTLVIALVDSTLKGTPAYTPLNIALRLLILLPLAFGVTVGASPYAGRLRRTFGLVAVADALLPVVFPAGMAAFLVVHLLNAHNFWQEVELRRGRWASVLLPAAGALGLALFLYVRFLFPTMDAFFRVVVAVYLVPIAAARGLAVTGWVLSRARGAARAAAG
ncbi:MAG: lysoplasmalogenase family protein, partial [bacterium]